MIIINIAPVHISDYIYGAGPSGACPILDAMDATDKTMQL